MNETHLRVMSIMAHQDDFEFSAAGSFALLRQAYGDRLEIKLLTTSRGASGHHQMNPEETFARRVSEARQSAALIGATYKCLTLLDGSHVQGQVLIDRNLLGGLWNAIRDFEPDVIFCPPLVSDPLAGIHVDHQTTAMAMQMIAYQIGVPHAYPTILGPKKLRVKTPLMINVDDPYARSTQYHIRQDISSCYVLKTKMALCHQSQVFEWLPFIEGKPALSEEEWVKHFEERHSSTNQRYGFPDAIKSEYFAITRWGRSPEPRELEKLFPQIISNIWLD